MVLEVGKRFRNHPTQRDAGEALTHWQGTTRLKWRRPPNDSETKYWVESFRPTWFFAWSYSHSTSAYGSPCASLKICPRNTSDSRKSSQKSSNFPKKHIWFPKNQSKIIQFPQETHLIPEKPVKNHPISPRNTSDSRKTSQKSSNFPKKHI